MEVLLFKQHVLVGNYDVLSAAKINEITKLFKVEGKNGIGIARAIDDNRMIFLVS